MNEMFDIIIVSYNARDKLGECIDSVRRYTKNCDYLMTVVDNGSRDRTVKYLRCQKGINVIYYKKNLGKPKALNLAIKNTFRDLIVCLDDDARVTRGWIDGLYSQLKNNLRVGIVGCKIVFPNKLIFCADSILKPPIIIGHGEIDFGQRDYIKETDMVAATCWLMRRELISKVGYFDERFFPNQYEDNDYCLRTRLAGYKIIYNGRVSIIHDHLYREGGFGPKNTLRYFKKWNNLKVPFSADSYPVDRYNARGIGYLKNKRYTQALKEFQKTAQIDKRFSLPYFMGITLKGKGEYLKATREFKKVLRLHPKDIDLLFTIATCYQKLRMTKAAANWYQKALDLIVERIKEEDAGL